MGKYSYAGRAWVPGNPLPAVRDSGGNFHDIHFFGLGSIGVESQVTFVSF